MRSILIKTSSSVIFSQYQRPVKRRNHKLETRIASLRFALLNRDITEAQWGILVNQRTISHYDVLYCYPSHNLVLRKGLHIGILETQHKVTAGLANRFSFQGAQKPKLITASEQAGHLSWCTHTRTCSTLMRAPPI